MLSAVRRPLVWFFRASSTLTQASPALAQITSNYSVKCPQLVVEVEPNLHHVA